MKYCGQMLTTMLTVFGLFAAMPLQANTNYCSKSTARNFIHAKLGRVDQARLDTPAPAQVETSINEINSLWVFDRDPQHTKSIGFNFRYSIVDLESIDAMTNGHLHTWDFPFQGRLSNIDSELFYDITPAISVSSNVLKNPELIGSDGLQLYTSLVYKKNTSVNTAWFLGFRSDHRFGSYKAYPVVGVCIQAANDWILQLALPDFSIQRRFNRRFSLELFVEPVGNQWQVFSKDKTRESNFIYDAMMTGLAAKWRIDNSMNVSLAMQNQTNRRFSFVLDNNSFVESEAESARGLVVTAEFWF